MATPSIVVHHVHQFQRLLNCKPLTLHLEGGWVLHRCRSRGSIRAG